MKKTDKCPVCGAPPFFRVKDQIDFGKTAGIYRESFKEYFFDGKKETDYLETFGICTRCNTIYREYFFDENDIINIYSSSYSKIEDKLSEYDGFVYNNDIFKNECSQNMLKYVNHLKNKYNWEINTIFDIGGRDGFRLYDLAEIGYICKVFDPIQCPPCSDKVVKHNLYSFQIPKEEKADLIILCNVLEHCVNLQEIIENIYSHLNDGGFLFIEVPCDIYAFFNWLIFYRILRKNFNIDITHHVFFSQKSVKYLIQAGGITVLASAIASLPAIHVKVMEITGRKIPGTTIQNKLTTNIDFLYLIWDWVRYSFKRTVERIIR